jgi:hypothetical protein
MVSPNSKDKPNTVHDDKDFSYEGRKDVNLSLAPYTLLVFLRVVLTLLPQTGYIQPDEYFQSIEIINGK